VGQAASVGNAALTTIFSRSHFFQHVLHVRCTILLQSSNGHHHNLVDIFVQLFHSFIYDEIRVMLSQ